MKNILLVGINKKAYSLKKILGELMNRKIEFIFFKWGDLVFSPTGVYGKNIKINFDLYDLAILGAPYYDLVVAENKKSLKKKRIPIKLTNELNQLAQKLREENIPFLNESVLLSQPFYDKFCQSLIFYQHGIPSIPTLHLTDNGSRKVKGALKKFRISYPLVAKKSFGGLGLDVFKISNSSKLETFLKSRRNQNLIFQPYLKNDGDFRVLVCANKALGIIKRQAPKKGWKNNFSLGGMVSAHVEPEMADFCEKICKKIGFDFAGVDILKENGQYRIIEINLFPGFKGFEKVFSKVNVAKSIVDLMLKKKK